MTEQQTPVMEPSAAPASPQPPKKAPEKKKKQKKVVKTVIITVVIVAVIAAAAWAIWFFVFAEKPDKNAGEPIYDTAQIGTIVNTVQGGGAANAKDSATITLAAAGVVQEVFVSEGQVVAQGDPLYVITSSAAEAALANAREGLQKQQEAMTGLQKEMADLQKSRSELTITAPHDGKLTEVKDLKIGDPLTSSTPIAVVVDDTRLKLSLYYSYAYENDISVGQTAEISIPATMTTETGTVEKINKVQRVTPEGGVTFEVIFVVKNPGTLTAGMTASAVLSDASGAPIYPYENGAFAYYQSTTVSTKAAGPVEKIADLMDYANVKAGQVLVVQGTNDIDELIRTKQDQIIEAQKSLAEAQKKVEDEEKNLENFSAVAPISGTVVACSMTVGQEVASGYSAITIADNTIMTVNIDVDERSVDYIKTGMDIQLSDYNGNNYMGVVESVAVQGKPNDNGITVFPAVVRVDNSSGALRGNVYLNYTFNAATAENCVTIPIQDVRYYTPDGADKPRAVVYLRTDTPPDDAIDKTELPQEMQDAIPKDCVVVPVVTGISDDMNVEIVSGVQEGQDVYNSTPSADGSYNARQASDVTKG